MADAGFPVGKEALLDSVQHLVTEVNRENPFTNNRPSRTWYHNFLKRNPELSTRTEDWVESGDSLNDISSESFSNNDEEGPIESEYKEGDYVVVTFPGKKKTHKYVCVIQEILIDGDAEVVAMICSNEAKTSFKLNENDVSTIKLNQIVQKLEFPNMISVGDRLKYEFKNGIDVDG